MKEIETTTENKRKKRLWRVIEEGGYRIRITGKRGNLSERW